MENLFFLGLILVVIVTLQSIVGVGVLVLGTPIFLILGYDIISLLSLLLPLSLSTSLLNLSYIKISKKLNFSIEKVLKKKFFLLCIPSIFIGLLLLKNLQSQINFNILVSIVIFFSLFLKLKRKKVYEKISSKFRDFILFLMGIIHGISNSGGTILSLFLVALNNNSKLKARYHITYFYFYLALSQYLLFLYLFQIFPDSKYFPLLAISLIVGTVIGNILEKLFTNNIFNNLISIIAFFAAIILII